MVIKFYLVKYKCYDKYFLGLEEALWNTLGGVENSAGELGNRGTGEWKSMERPDNSKSTTDLL